MTGARYFATFTAGAVAALFVSASTATLMLSGFEWLDDSGALRGSGWGIALYVVRVLLMPVMLVVAIRAGWRAIKIMRGRVETLPPTANSAIIYYGVTAAYVSLGMFVPIFWVAVPALIEPILYPLAALLLLVATIRAIRVHGQLPGRPVVSPQMTAIFVTVAWVVVIGASAAYAQVVLAGDPIVCVGGECPPGRTLGAVGFMVTTTTVTAAVMAWGLRSPMGMTQQGIISAVAFACLALLFPITIMPAFVMPYDAFVPSFFYGLAAVVFLIVAVARKDEEHPP